MESPVLGRAASKVAQAVHFVRHGLAIGLLCFQRQVSQAKTSCNLLTSLVIRRAQKKQKKLATRVGRWSLEPSIPEGTVFG